MTLEEPGDWYDDRDPVGVTGKVTVLMSPELDGELELESLKGRSLSIRAVLVPDTGRPRILSCCLSSDTCHHRNNPY